MKSSFLAETRNSDIMRKIRMKRKRKMRRRGKERERRGGRAGKSKRKTTCLMTMKMG